MEKDLGTTIEVVNKTGGGHQVGITFLVMAKPDGYTFGKTNRPAPSAIYLDADRKAAFGRKDLQPIAVHVFDPIALAVAKDSPYKNFKDFMDAAKTNPGKDNHRNQRDHERHPHRLPGAAEKHRHPVCFCALRQ